MKVSKTELPGVLLLEPRVFRDARGFFFESWNQERYEMAGIDVPFVQDNVSYSARGVLRGLHYQQPGAQAKLVGTLTGAIFDVAVDVRRDSPTYGRWEGFELNADARRQVFIPPGFAHGFKVLSESALVSYKVSGAYRPECEVSLAWDDPDLGIDWPGGDPVLSAKDRAGIRLRDIPRDRQPVVGA